MKRLLAFFGLALALVMGSFAFAQVAAPAANPDTDFLSQLIQFVQSYGGMATMAKISGIILLIIAITKTSFIAPLYAKLPDVVKTLLAPILGLAGAMITQGGSLTWASAFAFISAGAGAVFFHEILDGVKAIPGLGAIYVTIIGIAESVLFKPDTAPAAIAPKA